MGKEGYSLVRELGLYALPEDCISAVISLTSPQDACRLCTVSTALRAAADSDTVWERFLAPEIRDLIPGSMYGMPKKDVFFKLCDRPIHIDHGTKSLSLDKRSGKKCCMVSARGLMITWGDTPSCWRWVSLPDARFPEVAELAGVCWLEIHGKISSKILSQNTLYCAYLVFKQKGAYGFGNQPVEVNFGPVGTDTAKRRVYLETEEDQLRRYQMQSSHFRMRFRDQGTTGFRTRLPDRETNGSKRHCRDRGDGWLEIELGELFNKPGDDAELEMSVLETNGGNWKGGIVVLGIEIRPKDQY